MGDLKDMWSPCGLGGRGFGMVCHEFLDYFDLGGHERRSVMCFKKCLMWLVDIGEGLWW